MFTHTRSIVAECFMAYCKCSNVQYVCAVHPGATSDTATLRKQSDAAIVAVHLAVVLRHPGL